MPESEKESIFNIQKYPPARHRKAMLPGWLKLCCWVVLCIMPLMLSFTLWVSFTDLAGISSEHYIGTYGWIEVVLLCLIIVVLALKIAVAYTLLKEKDIAVLLGLTDAILGVIMSAVAFAFPKVMNMPFHRETMGLTDIIILSLLFVYCITLLKIKDEWRVDAYTRNE